MEETQQIEKEKQVKGIKKKREHQEDGEQLSEDKGKKDILRERDVNSAREIKRHLKPTQKTSLQTDNFGIKVNQCTKLC